MNGTDNNFKTTARHEQYYLTGGDAVLMAENVFFRVHRYFFERESIYFKDKFTVPASPGKEQAGTSESNAILLQDVGKKERTKPHCEITVERFETFLWVFYNPLYSLYNTTVEQWEWILDLADRWKFTEVKNLAVRELEKLEIPLVDRITIYQDYDVGEEHLMHRYAELCKRDEEIDVNIGERIGWKVALRLQNARERALRRELGGKTPSPADVDTAEMLVIIGNSLGGSTPRSPAPSHTARHGVTSPDNGQNSSLWSSNGPGNNPSNIYRNETDCLTKGKGGGLSGLDVEGHGAGEGSGQSASPGGAGAGRGSGSKKGRKA